MQQDNSLIYENKVEAYRKDVNRLKKANHILITEIKELLTLCYGNRRVLLLLLLLLVMRS